MSLIHWIASSSLLILGVIGLRRLLRGRIGPALQYALWLPVLLRLLIPGVVLQSAFSLANVTERTRLSQNLEILEDAELRFYRDGEATVAFDREQASDGGFTSADNTPREEYDRLALTARWRDTLTAVWLMGVVVTGGVLIGCNMSFAGRLRRSREKVDIKLSPLKVYVCEGLKTPCLFGLLPPSIYITPEVEQDETKLRHVLAHEETHYRHGDHLWGTLRGAALALHWYNPLVWWAAALSRRDAELCCDAGAIRRLGERERADYGRTLIGLTVQKTGGYDLLCCATTMTGGKKLIQERIEMIADQPKTKWIALICVVVAAAVAAVCLFTGAKKAENVAQHIEFSWNDGQPYVLTFVGLAPGETVYSEEEITFETEGELYYQITYEHAGFDVVVGVERIDGYGYVQERRTGGRAVSVLTEIPAGTYRVYVRNSEDNERYRDTSGVPLELTGALAFGDRVVEYDPIPTATVPPLATPYPTVLPTGAPSAAYPLPDEALIYDVLPCSLNINRRIYQTYFRTVTKAAAKGLEDSDVEILGYVTENNVEQNHYPYENGQTNFPAAGCPYGTWGDMWVLKYDGKWVELVATNNVVMENIEVLPDGTWRYVDPMETPEPPTDVDPDFPREPHVDTSVPIPSADIDDTGAPLKEPEQ